jgi:outer membrane protein
MKTFLKTMLPAFAMTALLAGSASAQTKLATIDLRKVFDNYWKTTRATAALKESAADMEKEDKKLLEEYNKLKDDYQKILSSANDAAIAPEEKEKRKKSAETKLLEIKDAEQQITQFERQARSTLDTKKLRMREDVLKEIRAAIEGKAKSAGYSMVVDTSADSFNSQASIFLYTNGENDITETILSQLNATAPADPPKPAEKKDEKKPDEKKK